MGYAIESVHLTVFSLNLLNTSNGGKTPVYYTEWQKWIYWSCLFNFSFHVQNDIHIREKSLFRMQTISERQLIK